MVDIIGEKNSMTIDVIFDYSDGTREVVELPAIEALGVAKLYDDAMKEDRLFIRDDKIVVSLDAVML